MVDFAHEFKSGLVQETPEQRQLLLAGATGFNDGALMQMGAAAPESVSHRSWLKTENQLNQGSCVGHMRSSGGEVLNYIGTGGQVIQLNRQFSYITAQRVTGIQGDRGATIYGAAVSAGKDGECQEALWPYTGQYNTNIPQKCFEEAKQHLIRKYVALTTYEQCKAWIGSGVGVVWAGVPWHEYFANNRNGVIDGVSGRSLGGHAILFCGYNAQGDLDMVNSHSEQWGNKGWAFWKKNVIDWLLQTSGPFYGVTDMQVFQARKIKKMDWV